jgi:hypothetical protein
MSREITTTTPRVKELIPEGKRTFIITGPVAKKFGKASGAELFIFPLQYKDDAGNMRIGEQMLLGSTLGPLLRVLGCNEVSPNIFDWDTEELEGRAFIAQVGHKPDKKDPSITRQYMGHFEQDTEGLGVDA